MCYFVLTPSNNKSLNYHCRNIYLSEELHFQQWQAGKKMWEYPSQVQRSCEMSYRQQKLIHIAIQFLQLYANSEIKIYT